jgi:hypothetical protein
MARSSSSVRRDCREVRSRRIRFATSWNLVTAREATPVAVGVLNQIGSPSVTPGTPTLPGNGLHRRRKFDAARTRRLEEMEREEQIDRKRLSIPTCSSRWEQPMCARALRTRRTGCAIGHPTPDATGSKCCIGTVMRISMRPRRICACEHLSGGRDRRFGAGMSNL